MTPHSLTQRCHGHSRVSMFNKNFNPQKISSKTINLSKTALKCYVNSLFKSDTNCRQNILLRGVADSGLSMKNKKQKTPGSKIW